MIDALAAANRSVDLASPGSLFDQAAGDGGGGGVAVAVAVAETAALAVAAGPGYALDAVG